MTRMAIMDSETTRLLWEAIIVTLALSAVGAGALYLFVQSRRNAPDSTRRWNQLATELSNRISTLEKERERDHAAMLRIQLRLAEVEIGVRILIAQVRRLGAEPDWMPAADTPATVSDVIDDVALYRSIAALFNVEELDDIAFRLGLDPESLEGKRKETRARSLVTAAKQRDLLPELIDVARQLRPEGRF